MNAGVFSLTRRKSEGLKGLEKRLDKKGSEVYGERKQNVFQPTAVPWPPSLLCLNSHTMK
jgi:hypothetical protein